MLIARAIMLLLLCGLVGATANMALAQVPDHPIITEVYLDPAGNDGPVGRSCIRHDARGRKA